MIDRKIKIAFVVLVIFIVSVGAIVGWLGNIHLPSGKEDTVIIEIAPGMTAGDIYLTLEIAKITKKSVNQVVEAYQNNREKGWGTIAKELGIVPGSDEFNQLKDKLTNHA